MVIFNFGLCTEGTNTFLLTARDMQKREFLQFIIARGILADKQFSGFAVYELPVSSMLGHITRGGHPLRLVEKVINQVVNNTVNPSVLFVPNMDLVDSFFRSQKLTRAFYSQLERVHSARTMIFATNCSKMSQKHGGPENRPEWNRLFGEYDGRTNKATVRHFNHLH